MYRGDMVGAPQNLFYELVAYCTGQVRFMLSPSRLIPIDLEIERTLHKLRREKQETGKGLRSIMAGNEDDEAPILDDPPPVQEENYLQVF
ncbi:hypothetical protein ACH5RR_006881 [Cinchona calisaya]|uniref:Uncharacterized protein n=1 Tax=Cinchona calisaya TaxID=153742 RepID=A0ABD3AQC3_9GENT